MSNSIRAIIAEKSLVLRDIDALGPNHAAKELVELASLLSSLNKEIIDSLMWYNQRKLMLLEECKNKVSEAKIRAEATEEFRQWQERLLIGKALEEMIRSLKYFLRQSENEMKLQ